MLHLKSNDIPNIISNSNFEIKIHIMKRFLLIHLLLYIGLQSFTQPLTINQTLKYLNNISEENPGSPFESGGCTIEHHKRYSLKENGDFHIDDIREFYNCRDKTKDDVHLTYKKVLHVTEIDIKNIKIERDHITIPCKEGNCIIVTKGPKVSSSGYQDRSKLSVWSRDNYTLKKKYNALIFLLTSIIESGKYNRADLDDPFAPSNFKDPRYKIVSGKDYTNIKLGEEKGVYTIWVSFGNGKLKKKFILDSGASEISISSGLERELINQGIIKKENYIQSGLYQLADGSIVSARRFIIPSLKVGDFTVYNVIGSVGTQNSPLLLGKNFLDKFKGWSIDNNTNILNLKK